MYTIENFDNLPKGFINRSELAKRTILDNLDTIDKETLAMLCNFVNPDLYEFVIYGQQINDITYSELKEEMKEKLIDCPMYN